MYTVRNLMFTLEGSMEKMGQSTMKNVMTCCKVRKSEHIRSQGWGAVPNNLIQTSNKILTQVTVGNAIN